MRKTNSPLSILTLTSSKAGRADDLYCLLTWSRVIITARQCSGEFRWHAKINRRAAPMSATDLALAAVVAAVLGSGSCWACRRAAGTGTSAVRTAAAVWAWSAAGGAGGA